jgi:hypothetical protein
MKKSGILFIVFGIMLAFGSLAYAVPVVDVQQYPTGYFVDSDANKYAWPYYRWSGDDWGWTHNAISANFSTATLNISAFDVDEESGEVDEIYAYDNGVMTLIGTLVGVDNTWSYTTFTLGSNFFDDIASGLQVWMVIDADDEGWAVTLSKSALSVDSGQIPNPNPGAVPEPATFLLFGAGLAGVGLLKKKFTR